MNRTSGLAALLAYVGTVVAANWMITRYGMVPVWWGLQAPAGVYAAGLAFTARDVAHRAVGRWPVVGAMAVGAALSYALADPFVATASAVAFAVSELADLLVYERLSRRFVAAVVASNAVGLLIDSVLFLWVAFGSLEFLSGQVVGKALMTGAVLPLVWALRQYRAVAT